MYNPLQDGLRVGDSDIHGTGVFATRTLIPGEVLGHSHYKMYNPYQSIDDYEWGRTPLGGFGNHSDTPNCMKMKLRWYCVIIVMYEILEGEEVTWRYDMYLPEEKEHAAGNIKTTDMAKEEES